MAYWGAGGRNPKLYSVVKAHISAAVGECDPDKPALERLRCIINVYDDVYNNDLCNTEKEVFEELVGAFFDEIKAACDTDDWDNDVFRTLDGVVDDALVAAAKELGISMPEDKAEKSPAPTVGNKKRKREDGGDDGPASKRAKSPTGSAVDTSRTAAAVATAVLGEGKVPERVLSALRDSGSLVETLSGILEILMRPQNGKAADDTKVSTHDMVVDEDGTTGGGATGEYFITCLFPGDGGPACIRDALHFVLNAEAGKCTVRGTKECEDFSEEDLSIHLKALHACVDKAEDFELLAALFSAFDKSFLADHVYEMDGFRMADMLGHLKKVIPTSMGDVHEVLDLMQKIDACERAIETLRANKSLIVPLDPSYNKVDTEAALEQMLGALRTRL
jgi:hypothetical protein